MFGSRRRDDWKRRRNAVAGLVAAACVAAWPPHPAAADAGAPDGGPEIQDHQGPEDRKIPEDRGPAVRQPVIPPGQEEALAKMLGRGATLPGDCEFANAHVEQSVIGITYNCPSGEVAVEVYHPSEAPDGATRTAQFAVALRRGEAPEAFFPGLLAQIRAEENAAMWAWTAPSPGGSGSAQAGRGYRRIVTLTTVGAIVVAAWWLRRRAGEAARAE